MLQWFHNLPDFGVFVVVLLLLGLPLAAAAHVFGGVARRPHHPGVASGAWEATKLLVASAGAVLAFSLVQVQGNLRNAQELVIREATTLEAMYRHLASFGADAVTAARPVLRAYTASIVQDDWPAMSRGRAQRSAKTDAAFAALSNAIHVLAPADSRQGTLYGELIRATESASVTRESRLADAAGTLPGLFWYTMLALFLLLAGLATMMERKHERTLAMAGIAIGLSLMIALVIVIDGPYDGETAVGPGPLLRVLSGLGT